MPDTKSTAATPAATVVMLRETGSGLELLMVERAGGMGFAGGALVFPGGKVEPGDSVIASDPALSAGFAGLPAVDAAARVASARETFEEADVLLSDGPPVDAALKADWRARLNAGSAAYGDFLHAAGHRVVAAHFIPFAHWCPPEGLHRRFDTLFYLALLPAGAVITPDGREAVAAHWYTAAEAIKRADRNEARIIFPTRRNLERLAQYPTAAALFASLAATPLTRIQPAIVERADGKYLTIPKGCDYPVTEERLDGAMRG